MREALCSEDIHDEVEEPLADAKRLGIVAVSVFPLLPLFAVERH